MAMEPWNEFYTTKDTDLGLEIFYKIYNTALYKAFPLKKLSRNRSKDKKWITSGLKAIIFHKDILYKKYLLKPTPVNELQYLTFRNILTTCLRKAEESYYKDLITYGNQNLHKLWNIFDKIINPPKQSQNKISMFVFRDKIITDDQEIANTMNEHFSAIGENLAQKLNSTGHSAPNSFR